MRELEWRWRDQEFPLARPCVTSGQCDARRRSFNFQRGVEDDFFADNERPFAPKRTAVIFVPTDLSATATEAARVGITLARETGGRLVLFHVVHLNLTPYGPANPAWLKAALWQEAVTAAAPLLKRAQAMGVTATCVVEEGEPISAILKGAKQKEANIIVLATHQPGWLARWFRRRIVERVIRDADCPVLVLQTEPQRS